MARNDRLNVRVGLEGGEDVRRGLQNLGEAGQRAFQNLRRASDDLQQSTRGLAGHMADLRDRAVQVRERVDGLMGRFRGLGGEITRVGSLIAAAFSVRAIAQAADTWSDLTARVELATGAHGDAATIMERLGSMARRTYSDLQTTAEGYILAARPLRELGMRTGETLDFIEALNNAMVVSGARGAQAESVMRALTRAMQEGSLRGQNLQTVLEQGGRVTEVLADHLGVTVAELFQMGRQGRITGKIIREALVGNLERLRQEADDMPATIQDGMMLIRNAFLQWIGTGDQAIGMSNRLANVLIWVADNFDTVATAALALGAAFVFIRAVRLAAELFGIGRAALALLVPLTKMGVVLLANPLGLFAVAAVVASVALLALTGNLESFTNTLTGAVGEFLGFGEAAEEAAQKADDALGNTASKAEETSGAVNTAANAFLSLVTWVNNLGSSADEAADNTKDLADEGVKAGDEVTTGMADASEQMAELDASVLSTAASFKAMAEAAEEAARAAARAASAGSGNGDGAAPGFSGGGRVYGPGTSTSDSILARLSRGEFVVRAAAVRKYGSGLLSAINSMRFNAPGFNLGGLVDLPVPALAGGGVVRAAGRSTLPSSTSGRPLNLSIDGQEFKGLIAPEDTASQLVQYATKRQVRRAGRTPSWHK